MQFHRNPYILPRSQHIIVMLFIQQSSYYYHYYHYYYYYFNCFMAPWTVSGTTQMSWYQKGKTNLDSLEQEIVSGSGICWAICKSAPHPRQITTPAPHHSIFTGWMPFLPSNQQHQSTEGPPLKTNKFATSLTGDINPQSSN